MTRKLITVAALAAVSLPALVTVGCSTAAKPPYSLTGAPVDEKHDQWLQRQRFTDEKGRYHPELAEANTPIR